MLVPWYTCEITATGPAEDGVVYVRLRDTGGVLSERWFKAVATMKREMLTTALAAMSSGRRVTANVANDAEYSDLNRLYVLR
jgi:hypothetical protein